MFEFVRHLISITVQIIKLKLHKLMGNEELLIRRSSAILVDAERNGVTVYMVDTPRKCPAVPLESPRVSKTDAGEKGLS